MNRAVMQVYHYIFYWEIPVRLNNTRIGYGNDIIIT